MSERETLDVDVLFVGGGPAGLAGAIRLRQLLRQHNERTAREGKKPLELSIALLEKGREIGSHALSGAVLDPKGLRELYPDFEALGCPLESKVTDDSVWFLTSRRRIPLPFVPPPLRNHGNYVVSLGRLVRWPAARAEAEGVDLFPGFAALEPPLEGDRLGGGRGGGPGADTNRGGEAHRRPRCPPPAWSRSSPPHRCPGRRAGCAASGSRWRRRGTTAGRRRAAPRSP